MTPFEEYLKKSGADIVQTKYQSVTLSKAAGTAAGTYASDNAHLDTNYHVCDGISFTEVTDGDLVNDYKVAIENNNGKVIEPISIGAVAVDKNDGSSPDARFLTVLFDNKSGGDKTKLLLITEAATATDALKVVATFRLRKLSKEIKLPNI